MARNIDGDLTNGQGGGTGAEHESQTHTIDASGQTHIDLPDASFITDATMIRDGQDLILENGAGQTLIVENYFQGDSAPMMTSPNGAILSPALVESFVHSNNAGQYAQAGSMDDVSPVGEVTELSGNATVTHADGTKETITLGTKIFQGDVVETQGDGAVNITFVDETSFAVSENAKMAIDEYVFDPASGAGKTDFSVLKGVFVFTSGLIGREDPDDVTIDTPVGSIGIRGTTIMGDIDPTGESQITVVEGAIVVRTAAGEQTLAQQFESVKLTSNNEAPEHAGTLNAQAVTDAYGAVKGVSGGLFSAFGTDGSDPVMADDATAPATDESTTPADTTAEPAADSAQPANDGAAQESTPADTTAPVPATDAETTEDSILLQTDDPFAMDMGSGFDTAAGLSTGTSTGMAPAPALSTTTASTDTSFTATTGAIAPTGTTATTATTTTTTTTTTATATPAPPPLALAITNFTIDENATAGHTIATVRTTVAFPETMSFTFSGPTDGSNALFELVQTGQDTADIRLTSAGQAAIDGGLSYSFTIDVTQPSNGRTATLSDSVTIVDVVVTPPYDVNLNDVLSGADSTSGNFIPSIAANSHHGNAIAAIGDYDGNGTANYIFASDTTLFVDDNGGNIYQYSLSTMGITNTSDLVLTSVGDVNRDGFLDYMVGAGSSGSGAGRAVLIDGSSGATFGLNGTPGLPSFGQDVTALGDINGDGFADFMVGAPLSNTGGTGAGSAYIYLGGASIGSVFTAGSHDYVIDGATGDQLGEEAEGLGDINADGYGDFAVAVPKGAGSTDSEVWVYLGGPGFSPGAYFTITGIDVGADMDLGLVALGDMNGNGRTDFGVYEGGTDTLHVFYGEGSSYAPAGMVDVSSSNLKFIASGANSKIDSGGAVGDVNGDGYSDMALAVRTDSSLDIYMIYGRSGLTGTIDLDSLTLASHQYSHLHLDLTDPAINLTFPNTDAFDIEISAMGDLNGDGLDDFGIGTPGHDGGDGGLYIIYGQSEGQTSGGFAVIQGTNATATASGQALLGTAGADNLSDANFAGTTMNAGNGNDVLTIGVSSVKTVDGGAGNDTLRINMGGLIDLSSADGTNSLSHLTNIENISLQSTSSILKLDMADIFRLLQESGDNTLAISTNGAISGNLQLFANGNVQGLTAAGFTAGGTSMVNGEMHNSYTFGSYTLYVDQNVTVAV